MAIKVGDKIPSVTLSHKTADGIQKVTTDDFFKGKTVVLFGLPGAFTPTCSAKHLPGFVQNAKSIKGKGQKVGDSVMMLADGNGDFSKAVGLTMDATGYGMGLRASRYAMVVKDGVVKNLNVEAPGAFEVSSADAIMKVL